MLRGLVATAQEEKHQEQLHFAAYEQFCRATLVEKKRAVAEASEQIELSRADVQKYGTEADRLALEIEGHASETAVLDEEVKAATVVRSTEREEYLALRRDYTESLDALAQAIAVLKSQKYDRPGRGPTALVEEAFSLASRLPGAGRAIQAFLERGSEEPDLTFVPAVPTTAYEPRSSEVISMLEGLHEKFKGELEELDRQEVQRRHAFDTLAQDRGAAIEAADRARSSKTESKAKSLQRSAEASADLRDVSASFADDTAYVQELEAACQQKKSQFDARQSLRKEEVAALGKAIEILSGEDVAQAAAKHLPASLSAVESRGMSLVQLRHTLSRAPSNQLRAAAYLRGESTRLGSRVLSTIAVRVQDDPFGKVKALIQELLERLMTEATDEAEHKGWCDTALATNEQTRKSKAQEVETLRADIEGLTAKVAQLKKDLAELSTAVTEIDTAVANATDLRHAEKAENAASVDEAQRAQVAVAEAVKVLTEFYGNASTAVALAQQRRRGRQEPPPIFDSPYRGQQSATGGVLGMLEVIHSDFARVESDVASAEAAAQAEYDQFMESSSISKVQKETDIKHKAKSQRDAETTLDERASDLESTEERLSTALAEFEKLKPACLGGGQTYEERVGRRRDEVEALKEALRILSGEDTSLSQQR